MDSINEIIQELNDNQKRAVLFDPVKVLQVKAPPGTGKTKVVISRIIYLLSEARLPPDSIICTTFGVKAKEEIMERLAKALDGTGIDYKQVKIGTFHGVCYSILRKYGYMIGCKNLEVISEGDQEKLITKLIEKAPPHVIDAASSIGRKKNLMLKDKDGTFKLSLKLIRSNISKLKSQGQTVENYMDANDVDTALLYFYERYHKEMCNQNKLDFDDLLLQAYLLLKQYNCLPLVQHVLVDEFQDTSILQMQLMFLLARGKAVHCSGITVVGDPDQCIYAFRDAMPHNFRDMIQISPVHVETITLDQNYRSTQKIVDSCQNLMTQQQKGRDNGTKLYAQYNSRFGPLFSSYHNFREEADGIASEILYLKSLPNIFTYNSFSILVRQRRQIPSIEKALIEARIPYHIIKGQSFWERKEVNSILNNIRLVLSDYELFALEDALLYPPRGLGKVGFEKIKNKLSEDPNAFKQLKKYYSLLPPKGKQVASKLIETIEKAREMFDGENSKESLEKIFDYIYENSYLKYELTMNEKSVPNIKQKYAKSAETNTSKEPNLFSPKHLNVMLVKEQLLNFSNEYNYLDWNVEEDDEDDILSLGNPSTSKTGNQDIEIIDLDSVEVVAHSAKEDESKITYDKSFVREFVSSIRLYGDKDDDETDAKFKEGRVTVCTTHKAKGSEWPVVFVPGCTEGINPSLFANDAEPEDSDDEEDSNKDGKPLKYKRTMEELLDEERRVFYVALTRAKVQLYLSSVETDSAREDQPEYKNERSRFITAEFLKTVDDHQKIFDKIENIKSFYKTMKIPFQETVANFSFQQLMEDYALYLSDSRLNFHWMSNKVVSKSNINLNFNNVSSSPKKYSCGFMSAAEHIGTSLSMSKSTQKSSWLAPRPSQRSASFNSLAPIQTEIKAPSASKFVNDSPTKKTYAPTRDIQRSPVKPKMFAPNGINEQRRAESLSPVKKKVKQESTLEKINSSNVKREHTRELTAAEILHNPNSMKLDNRPFLTSASGLLERSKLLSKIKKEENGVKAEHGDEIGNLEYGKKSRKPKKKTDNLPPEGRDIFSLLKKGKKIDKAYIEID